MDYMFADREKGTWRGAGTRVNRSETKIHVCGVNENNEAAGRGLLISAWSQSISVRNEQQCSKRQVHVATNNSAMFC